MDALEIKNVPTDREKENEVKNARSASLQLEAREPVAKLAGDSSATITTSCKGERWKA